MESNKVFRQAALDRLASPEQLHTLMQVTDAKGWLALIGCVLIITTGVLWGVFGSIQTKVDAHGILLHANPEEISVPAEGEIINIHVEPGAQVKRGQLVAQVTQPELTETIASVKRRLNRIPTESPTDGGMGDFFRQRRERLEKQLEDLTKKLRKDSRIVSPIDGRVLEVRAAAGDHVEPGASILALQRSGQRATLDVLLYVDSFQGKLLNPGMRVEISPSVARKERYGVMLGEVGSVDDYPATTAEMMRALRNERLVESFIRATGDAPIAVHATLITDDSTPSGYRWSSGRGPDLVLSSGTRCVAAVVTRTQRPVSLVFPALDFGG